MNLIPINMDKLTEFERQVHTLLVMDPDGWRLGDNKLAHKHLGYFYRVWGHWRKTGSDSYDKNYRKLSWRGRVMLGREYKRLVARAVNISASNSPKEDEANQAISTHLDANKRLQLGGYLLQRTKDVTSPDALSSLKPNIDALYASEIARKQQAWYAARLPGARDLPLQQVPVPSSLKPQL